MQLNAQTAKKNMHFQDLVDYIKEVKNKRNIVFIEARKIVESYMKENMRYCGSEGEPNQP